MKNAYIVRREALEAALLTVNYQIKHLKLHYSREQVRCWYIQRKRIIRELRSLPSDERIQEGAKRVNFSNSSKIKRK